MALIKRTSEEPMFLIVRLLQQPTTQYLNVLWRVDNTSSEGLWLSPSRPNLKELLHTIIQKGDPDLVLLQPVHDEDKQQYEFY